MNFNSSFLGSLPPVVKNLLIINVLIALTNYVLQSKFGIDLNNLGGLHAVGSEMFNPAQLVSYIFLHSTHDISHVFFNMFAVFMFGRVLESVWGSKRFLTFYLITGIGAGLIQLIVAHIRISVIEAGMSPESIDTVYAEGYNLLSQNMNYTDGAMGALNIVLNSSTVGASGAVFGILLAFGMLFPNTQLMLLFPPIPIKAKYFVAIYGVIELYLGVANSSTDNVAHWAHLGGMLFGFFMIRYWKKQGIV